MKDKLIHDTATYVQNKMAGESTGHDWFHVDRVRRNALTIAANEKNVDLRVVELAALLHDLGDWKTNTSGKTEETVLREAGDELGYDSLLIENVLEVILNMSYSQNLSGKMELSIEGQIVQDADRLDAMGAIGIARAFAYGGKKQRVIHDPTQKPMDLHSTDTYKKATGTTINHFYEKLFLLGKLLNTKTAKRIARDRELYMKAFLKEFYDEWDGKR